ARYVLGALYLRWRTRHREPVTESSLAGAPIYTAEIEVPVLCGWLRPVILVPLNFLEWNEDQKRAVILHELQHIARADNWTSLIWIAARALYWFHPLIWWISAQMQQQQELACDERVLASGVNASEYAALLLDTAARLTSSNLLACAMVSNKGELKRRIEHILSFSRPSCLTWRNGMALCAGVLLMLIAAVATPAGELPHTAGQPAIYTLGPGITQPRLIKKIEPQYSASARQRKIQGTVLLGLVIDSHGRTKDISVERSLDQELDRNAADAVRHWRFQPAMKDGRPVAVRVKVETNFRLK
ncbi:MAG TPA: M56 family metallopeptidase, partial [Bryobacteraceae bacterium]|nr:M56 family metallopeptidase [Bryobacteraceae bacterium]